MDHEQSPVTGPYAEEDVVLDFGPYEGRSISEVFVLDPKFYRELREQRQQGSCAIRRDRDKQFRLYINPVGEA